MTTKKPNPNDIVPEEAMDKIRLGWAKDRIAAADRYGTVTCNWDVDLMTSEAIIAEQQGWDEDDEAKQTDFSTSPYWLHYSGGGCSPIPVSDFEDLAAMNEDLCIYDVEMTYGSLNKELFSGDLGPTHLRALIGAGADVHAIDKNGHTPLHCLPALLNHELAKVLIEHGADVNARDQKGRTPLHKVMSGDAAQILLSNGANLDALDNEGMRPLDALQTRYAEYDDHPILCNDSAKLGIGDAMEIVSAATSQAELHRELESFMPPRATDAQEHEEPRAGRRTRRM